jgi:hypothetical protein
MVALRVHKLVAFLSMDLDSVRGMGDKALGDGIAEIYATEIGLKC